MKKFIDQRKVRIHHFLRKSEKYFKTDMVYFTRNSTWSLIGTGISWAISLLTVLAFANFIPKETYGAYQYVLAVIDILGITTLGGLDASFARSVARGYDGSLWETIKTKIYWGFIGGAGSIVVGSYYLLQGNSILGYSFMIAGILLPFWEAPGFFSSYLQGKKRFDLVNIYGTSAQLIASLIVISSVIFSGKLLIILTAYMASWGAVRFLFFFKSIRGVPPNTKTEEGTISYGKHISLMSAANAIASNIDNILLWHLLGPVPVAVYNFSKSVPFRFVELMKIANRLAFPKFASSDREVLRKTLPKKILLMFAGSFILMVIYIISAPYIFKWFLPQYTDSIPYTKIVALLIIFQPFSMFSTSLSAQGLKDKLYISQLSTPLIRIILIATLVPFLGLWGAVYAMLGTKIFESSLLYFLHQRIIR